MLASLLPLYRDEDLILCDIPLAKCYVLIHAIGCQQGANTVWADENFNSPEHQLNLARQIIRNNLHHNA